MTADEIRAEFAKIPNANSLLWCEFEKTALMAEIRDLLQEQLSIMKLTLTSTANSRTKH
jgi:hypothetical protein